MTYRKINLETELRRMAQGKKTTRPAREVAEWALQWVKVGLAQTDIEQLERLLQLPDPRGNAPQGL